VNYSNDLKKLECAIINFNFDVAIALHYSGYNYNSVVSSLNRMHYTSLHIRMDLRNNGRIVGRYVVQFQEVHSGSLNF
jgi:hypothetical protein